MAAIGCLLCEKLRIFGCTAHRLPVRWPVKSFTCVKNGSHKAANPHLWPLWIVAGTDIHSCLQPVFLAYCVATFLVFSHWTHILHKLFILWDSFATEKRTIYIWTLTLWAVFWAICTIERLVLQNGHVLVFECAHLDCSSKAFLPMILCK